MDRYEVQALVDEVRSDLQRRIDDLALELSDRSRDIARLERELSEERRVRREADSTLDSAIWQAVS